MKEMINHLVNHRSLHFYQQPTLAYSCHRYPIFFLFYSSLHFFYRFLLRVLFYFCHLCYLYFLLSHHWIYLFSFVYFQLLYFYLSSFFVFYCWILIHLLHHPSLIHFMTIHLNHLIFILYPPLLAFSLISLVSEVQQTEQPVPFYHIFSNIPQHLFYIYPYSFCKHLHRPFSHLLAMHPTYLTSSRLNLHYSFSDASFLAHQRSHFCTKSKPSVV